MRLQNPSSDWQSHWSCRIQNLRQSSVPSCKRRINASFGSLSNENVDVPNVKNATRSLYFLYFSALTRQIRAAGLKTKALTFVVWDRNVPSSEISNSRLLIMTSGTSTFSLLKLASNNCNASLGPGSAVREKGKKRGQIGKMLASEASPAVSWGGRKGRHSFPFPDYRSAFFFDFFFRPRWFFSFSPNAEPGPRLLLCTCHRLAP